MNPQIYQWALRWGIPHAALAELQSLFGIGLEPPSLPTEYASESAIQSLVRLEAGHKGLKLWRNNVGVLQDVNGRPVRYGLANDSPALNKAVKSGDLIGWRSVQITPAHVGARIAQFVSRECKRADWRFTGTEREEAQRRWIEAVVADGGDAQFVNREGSL